jgi:hypothetical protein
MVLPLVSLNGKLPPTFVLMANFHQEDDEGYLESSAESSTQSIVPDFDQNYTKIINGMHYSIFSQHGSWT